VLPWGRRVEEFLPKRKRGNKQRAATAAATAAVAIGVRVSS